MKYFFDTEFITGFKKPIPFLPTIGNWNKPEFYIHLVSIGIVDETGREYYAISNEFNPGMADDWVKKNVLSKLPERYVCFQSSSPREKEGARLWKSNQQIKMDIVEFMGGGIDSDQADVLYVPSATEMHAYFADYDWVVFCSLFGRMIDLPIGMPMYCRDLKQMLDEKIEAYMKTGYGRWYEYPPGSDKILKDHNFEECLNRIKGSKGYPKQTNEHNALDDAKWNLKLYNFIKSL